MEADDRLVVVLALRPWLDALLSFSFLAYSFHLLAFHLTNSQLTTRPRVVPNNDPRVMISLDTPPLPPVISPVPAEYSTLAILGFVHVLL